MIVPHGIEWLRGTEEGASWIASLPESLEGCAEQWGLRVGDPFSDSYVSWVAPATLPGGERVILKLQFPHRESEHEAEALRRWDGDGAVRLLDHDPSRHALLLEAASPGAHLATIDPRQGIEVLISLLPRLWVPAGDPFRSLADEAAEWVRNLPGLWEDAGRPFEESLLETAVSVLTHLAGSQGEHVLLHQDLHGDNVLSAQREPWLVIDPKPLAGEREFSLAPIIRSHEFGHGRDEVISRLDRLTSTLGLDRERARLWALGQTLAWSIEDGIADVRHVETARWLATSS